MKSKEMKSMIYNWKVIFLLPLSLLLVFLIASTAQVNPKSSKTLKSETIESEKVYETVEEMPLFNNGDPAIEFRKYLNQNLTYPKIAKEKGINGRVIIRFIINKEGKLVNATIAKAADPILNKEVLRIVSSSPAWVAGKHKGKPVSVSYNFPINFIIQ